MFIVYAYGACAYRLLQVRKEFEGEEKKEEVEEKEEKEEKEEDPSESLEVHLNGLPYEVTEDEIRQFFDGCGKIEEVRLSR